ncbi:MAG: purine-nucleoside phosphorylase [Endomicrobium sp.]|nr:purine-nucleoside phosphorylase [Endomicrobium sp.]
MKISVFKKIQETRKVLSFKNFKPMIAIIAGSGLGKISSQFNVRKVIKYSKVPYFPKATAPGHAGELLLSSYNNIDFLIFNGRFHYYEGHSAQDVIYPLRVMKLLGIKTLVLTAAVGALNKKYNIGDIVVLKDQINFTGDSPLIGPNFEEFGERFPNMKNVYDYSLRKKALSIAKNLNIKAKEGIYFAVSGPAYETLAEIKAYRMLGGDVVGMSVVYEATAAAHMKFNTLGLAYVSNMAAAISDKSLIHSEVLKTGEKVSGNLAKIIKCIISFASKKGER